MKSLGTEAPVLSTTEASRGIDGLDRQGILLISTEPQSPGFAGARPDAVYSGPGNAPACEKPSPEGERPASSTAPSSGWSSMFSNN